MTPKGAPPLAPTVRCNLCEDRGWVVRTDAAGVERASPCECAKRRGMDLALGEVRIPDRYRHCTLQNFAPMGNTTLVRARKAAEQFVAEWPQVDSGLLFSGPCGSGKTHLGVGILQDLAKRLKVEALYVDSALLIREIQDSFGSDELSRRELLRPVETAELVLLDDLGGSKASEWVRDTLAGIVNARYNSSRITLVTTRLPDDTASLSELNLEQQVGVAVRSRLWEMCTTWRLEAEDFRRSVRNASH